MGNEKSKIKYLSPYILTGKWFGNTQLPTRISLCGLHWFSINVYHYAYPLCSYDRRFVFKLSKMFLTMKDSQEWLDQYLISQGYKFLSEEQYNKFKLLI